MITPNALIENGYARILINGYAIDNITGKKKSYQSKPYLKDIGNYLIGYQFSCGKVSDIRVCKKTMQVIDHWYDVYRNKPTIYAETIT